MALWYLFSPQYNLLQQSKVKTILELFKGFVLFFGTAKGCRVHFVWK